MHILYTKGRIKIRRYMNLESKSGHDATLAGEGSVAQGLERSSCLTATCPPPRGSLANRLGYLSPAAWDTLLPQISCVKGIALTLAFLLFKPNQLPFGMTHFFPLEILIYTVGSWLDFSVWESHCLWSDFVSVCLNLLWQFKVDP